ncbi:hypothetical protein PSTG_02383 [Puccinia striiformis f. sp. tritici PST-78]|uniref:Uncharacterized protein n=1 Tax=Puccinia striiformis f. sp. tritici PST-78 TaxID=1165861 RepID=A0A0L0VZQ7_9BASI|nr:hypothetical protein PSTG_02383 [Puccinia striiformis f. sp. tritici PST-78]
MDVADTDDEEEAHELIERFNEEECKSESGEEGELADTTGVEDGQLGSQDELDLGDIEGIEEEDVSDVYTSASRCQSLVKVVRDKTRQFSVPAPREDGPDESRDLHSSALRLEAVQSHQDKQLSKPSTKTLALRITDPKDNIIRKFASRTTNSLWADISNKGTKGDKVIA